MENVAGSQAEPGAQKSEAAGIHVQDQAELEHSAGFKVAVSYNGVEKEFRVKPNDTVKQLLDQALHAFAVTGNVHTISLYSAVGQELSDTQTIKDAGVKPKDSLLLRPSAVKGG